MSAPLGWLQIIEISSRILSLFVDFAFISRSINFKRAWPSLHFGGVVEGVVSG